MRAALLAALLCAPTPACRETPTSGASGSAAPSASAARPAWKINREFAERLTRIFDELRDAKQLTEQACDSKGLARELGEGSTTALVAEHAALGRFGPPGAAPARPTPHHRWKQLTHPRLRALPSPVELQSEIAATRAAYEIRQIEQEHPLLAVLRVGRRALPQQGSDGQGFVAGELDAWLVLYDLRRGDRLCQTHVEVRSGEDVAVGAGVAADEGLWREFLLRIRGSLDDAARSLSRQVGVSLD